MKENLKKRRMKNLLFWYSVIMFTLTSCMTAFLYVSHNLMQYSFVVFLLVIGYTVSIMTFNWWRESKKDNIG